MKRNGQWCSILTRTELQAELKFGFLSETNYLCQETNSQGVIPLCRQAIISHMEWVQACSNFLSDGVY